MSVASPDLSGGALSRRQPRAAKQMLSAKAEHFTESVIREMTRLAMRYGAVNLAQGFPDFPAPAEIKRAAPSKNSCRSCGGGIPTMGSSWKRTSRFRAPKSARNTKS